MNRWVQKGVLPKAYSLYVIPAKAGIQFSG